MDQHPPNESPGPASQPKPTALPPHVAARVRKARANVPGLPWLLVGAAGSLAGIAIMLALLWTRADTPIETGTPPAAAQAPAPVVVESAPLPTWVGSHQAVRATDGSKTIAFELDAVQAVRAYMSPARPVLVVQCLSRKTDVFVDLGTPPDFEGLSEGRTVRLQMDDGPITVQQWELSESSRELLAPDGIGLVRRLAQAKRLHFGFTPFRAEPVTAEFAVEGFDRLAGIVANTCGWQLDAETPTRSARFD